jgi:PEP-CTERM motif
MMKSIKKTVLGLVLASCAAFNANAAPTFTGLFFVEPQFDFYTSQQWLFGVTQTDAKAGDTFEYDFLFNTPPEDADFSFLVRPDKDNSLTFSNVAWYAGDLTEQLDILDLVLHPWVAGGKGRITSGTYDLRLTGTFLADAAGFTGNAISAIPEPVSIALMGAGLAGIIGVRRRKVEKVEKEAQAA